MSIGKDRIFFFVVLVIGVVILWKSIPPSASPVLKVLLTSVKEQITSLDSPRNIDVTKEFHIDVLDFENGGALVHRSLGPLGFNHDFFMDIQGTFEVFKDGVYEFEIESDDGFRLLIDDTKISEFLTDRPIAKTKGAMTLSPGIHSMKLTYFQGYGLLGLRGSYGLKDESTRFEIGQSSYLMKWIRAK